jgi:hypothetical protein
VSMEDSVTPDETVAAWNAAFPPGTAVRYMGEGVPYYRTKGPAWNRRGVPVVECDGIPPFVGLEHPVPLDQLTAVLDRLTAVLDWDTRI